MDLIEWTNHYIKQRNMIKEDLISQKTEGQRVLCEYKESKAIYECVENLNLEEIKKCDKKEITFFVCSCNEHNFKTLLDNWNLFKQNKNLTFIFLSEINHEKWIIKPYIHSKIADPGTLKQGLRTMYDTCLGAGN